MKRNVYTNISGKVKREYYTPKAAYRSMAYLSKCKCKECGKGTLVK